MRISIITVCLNGKNYIERAIRSVLEQKNADVEYIIIDGGSTDGTVEIIKKYEKQIAFWISEPDQGLYYAMNKGIQKATGDIIAILNSDDWYTEDALLYVIEQFQVTYIDILFANVFFVSDRKVMTALPVTMERLKDMNKKMIVYHPATFVKREMFERIGLFNTEYKIAADYDWVLRALAQHPCIKCTEKVTTFFSTTGLSNTATKQTHEETLQIILKNTDTEKEKIDIEKFCQEKRLEWELEEKVMEGKSPCFDIEDMMDIGGRDIYIFGTGKIGMLCYRLLYDNRIRVAGFVDNCIAVHNEALNGVQIYAPEKLDHKRDFVIIATTRFETEIEKQLRKMEYKETEYMLYSNLRKELAVRL